jgi:hypothetical protein
MSFEDHSRYIFEAAVLHLFVVQQNEQDSSAAERMTHYDGKSSYFHERKSVINREPLYVNKKIYQESVSYFIFIFCIFLISIPFPFPFSFDHRLKICIKFIVIV